jgi:hypothetical protein
LSIESIVATASLLVFAPFLGRVRVRNEDWLLVLVVLQVAGAHVSGLGYDYHQAQRIRGDLECS